MGSDQEPPSRILTMAFLVERYGWPPSVIRQQDMELFAQWDALETFKAFNQLRRDFTALTPSQSKIVKPLQRPVERRMIQNRRKAKQSPAVASPDHE